MKRAHGSARWVGRMLPMVVACLAPAAVRAAPYEVAGSIIDVTAAPEQPEFMLGEPGYVLFKVANLSDRNLHIQDGGDYRNRLGRPESFKIHTAGPDGKWLSQPDAGGTRGGMMSAQKIPAKGEFVFRLFLPHWARFEQPGEHTITICRKLQITPYDGKDPFRTGGDIEVTATATFKIVPADDAKLGKLIEQLGAQMCDRQSDKAEEAEVMLASIYDERVIPHFVALAEMPHYIPRIAACESLGRFNNDQALAALEKLLKTTGAEYRANALTPDDAEDYAKGVRHAAVIALQDCPHPKALPLFWTFVDDPYYGVRLTVLHKAAKAKTPEARALIEKLTKDKNELVRNEALRYQKELAKDSPAP